MRSIKPTKLKCLVGGALIGVLICVTVILTQRPCEPRWKGHPLSEWIEAYDANLRFDEGDGRRSRFSEAEINEAIAGIGKTALPCLRYWITAKPSRVKPWLNQWLARLPGTVFRFSEDLDRQRWAETGFMAFGEQAQPLLPELIRLSYRRDADIRLLAYEAAFFTRPDRELFLPLAARALNEEDGRINVMAAQWMSERFPIEAEKAGLRDRFPQYFSDTTNLESVAVSTP